MSNQIIDWFLNLGTGVLASIIASTLGIGAFIWRVRKKSTMKIKSTNIKGDVIQGNKREGSFKERKQKNFSHKRNSKLNIKHSEIGGDLIQGDKEKR